MNADASAPAHELLRQLQCFAARGGDEDDTRAFAVKPTGLPPQDSRDPATGATVQLGPKELVSGDEFERIVRSVTSSWPRRTRRVSYNATNQPARRALAPAVN